MYRPNVLSAGSSAVLTATPARHYNKDRRDVKTSTIPLVSIGYPDHNIHSVESNGERSVFIYSTTPPGDDDICMICQESLTKGVPVVLPSCPQCHTGTSNTPRGLSVCLHANCCREYLDLNKPFGNRDSKGHIFRCGETFPKNSAIMLYHTPDVWIKKLDHDGVPPGKCDCCHRKFDTRAGLTLHMYPQRKDEWPWVMDYMSQRECILFRDNLDLFMCPKTLVKCPYCGFFDIHERMCAHKNLCIHLPERDRQLVKQFNNRVNHRTWEWKKNRDDFYDITVTNIDRDIEEQA